jgi:hypothetical protein
MNCLPHNFPPLCNPPHHLMSFHYIQACVIVPFSFLLLFMFLLLLPLLLVEDGDGVLLEAVSFQLLHFLLCCDECSCFWIRSSLHLLGSLVLPPLVIPAGTPLLAVILSLFFFEVFLWPLLSL